jgi:hypothetical protein
MADARTAARGSIGILGVLLNNGCTAEQRYSNQGD